MSHPPSCRRRAVTVPHDLPAGGRRVAGARRAAGNDRTGVRTDEACPSLRSFRSLRSSRHRLQAGCTVVALAAGAVAAGSTPAAGSTRAASSVRPWSAAGVWTVSRLATQRSAVTRSGATMSRRPAATPGAEAPPVGLRWQLPIQPRPLVLERFTPPAGPYAPGRRGVALAADPGQTVEAAGAGTVAFAGLVAGTPSVTVDHGSVSTTYQPVVAAVSAGVRVLAGTALGTVAALPQLCAPRTCLKWGAYLDGSAPRQYVDPMALLGNGPVRLLPPTTAVAGTRTVQPPRLLTTATAGVAIGTWSHPASTIAAPGAAPGSASGLDPTDAVRGVAGAGAVAPRPPGTASRTARASTAAGSGPGLSGAVSAPARTPADAPTAGFVAGSTSGAAAPRRDGPPASPRVAAGHPVQGSGPPASPRVAAGHPVQGSGPPSQSRRLRSSMRPGGRRVIEQLGAVGLVATVVGGGGLLLPVIEKLVSASARRRPRPLTRRRL